MSEFERLTFNLGSFDKNVFLTDPPNQDCSTAIPISLGLTPFSNVNVETGVYDVCAPIGNVVWYSYLSPVGGTLTVETCGIANFDTVLVAYERECPTNVMSYLECIDDACNLQSRISFPIIANTPYYITLGGYNGYIGSGFINITGTFDPEPNALIVGPRSGWQGGKSIPLEIVLEKEPPLPVTLTINCPTGSYAQEVYTDTPFDYNLPNSLNGINCALSVSGLPELFSAPPIEFLNVAMSSQVLRQVISALIISPIVIGSIPVSNSQKMLSPLGSQSGAKSKMDTHNQKGVEDKVIFKEIPVIRPLNDILNTGIANSAHRHRRTKITKNSEIDKMWSQAFGLTCRRKTKKMGMKSKCRIPRSKVFAKPERVFAKSIPKNEYYKATAGSKAQLKSASPPIAHTYEKSKFRKAAATFDQM